MEYTADQVAFLNEVIEDCEPTDAELEAAYQEFLWNRYAEDMGEAA